MSDLEPLKAWLAARPTPEEAIARPGGGDVQVGEDGERVIMMPCPSYSSTIAEFWTALEAAGWTHENTRDYMGVVRDWRAASGVAGPIRPEHMAGMDRLTLLNVLRQIDRGERFCDGTWAGAWRAGLLHAGARALIASG